jgi:hypothetical protein
MLALLIRSRACARSTPPIPPPLPHSCASSFCIFATHDILGCNSVLRVDLVTYSYGTYLALTGRRVTGEEAMNLGIATHFVHSSRLPVRSHAS